MNPRLDRIRWPWTSGQHDRLRVFRIALLIGVSLVLSLSQFNVGPANGAGSSYGGGGGGGGGGVSGLPVLGVHNLGASATTLTFNVPMATITVLIPAGTFSAHSQLAVLNAASIAQSPTGWGPIVFAYDIVGKNSTGTFFPTFKHGLKISIQSTMISGQQGVFKLVGNTWSQFSVTTNSPNLIVYYEASGIPIKLVDPLNPVTTTTHPRSTTTTTRPKATTTTTRPKATTTTKPKATTTTTRPKATTTTKPKATTTTKPRATTTTTKPKATTTTKPKTTTTHKGTTTTTKPKKPKKSSL